jgi:hypothetical protein
MQADYKEYPQDLIARRAYEIYQQRGVNGGSEFADWLQAEQEVLATPNGSTPPNGHTDEPVSAVAATQPLTAAQPQKKVRKPAKPTTRSRAKKEHGE